MCLLCVRACVRVCIYLCCCCVLVPFWHCELYEGKQAYAIIMSSLLHVHVSPPNNANVTGIRETLLTSLLLFNVFMS